MAACTNEIGWRNDSLKIVVFMTGSELHSALDGIHAGIIIPNDSKCHLKQPENTTDQEYYSDYHDEWYEREMDYPSFGEMRYAKTFK